MYLGVRTPLIIAAALEFLKELTKRQRPIWHAVLLEVLFLANQRTMTVNYRNCTQICRKGRQF